MSSRFVQCLVLVALSSTLGVACASETKALAKKECKFIKKCSNGDFGEYALRYSHDSMDDCLENMEAEQEETFDKLVEESGELCAGRYVDYYDCFLDQLTCADLKSNSEELASGKCESELFNYREDCN
jgi:hypothetical protein